MPTDLVKILRDKNLISESQSSEIQRQIVGKESSELEDFLLKNRIISDKDLLKVKSDFFHIPIVELEGRIIPKEILEMIPKILALSYKAIAFEKRAGVLKIAILDPGNLKAREAIDFIGRQNNLNLEYYTVSLKGMRSALKQYGSLETEVEEALHLAKSELTLPEEKEEEELIETTEGFVEVIKSAPVSKMTSVIFRYAVEGRASDIHIEPFRDKSRVRYRIDGVLRTSIILPKYVHSAIVSRIKVLANLKIDETRIPQDGRIHQKVAGKEVDFRISTLPLIDSEKVEIRILETSIKPPTFEELGFEGKGLEIIKANMKKASGLFLITGPTGSGKSTTLFSVLGILNEEKVNIVTLEDPVEYYIKGVNQAQVNPEVGFSFATGLRAILRQDPNIIMVGEIRDFETAELAIHAGLTGHMVFSTLHTRDVFGAIPRLVDMKVQPFLVASTLNLIIAQRLVRKICQHCCQEVKIPQNLKELIKKELESNKNLLGYFSGSLDNLTFYRGKGCPHCGGAGFEGRMVIFEVLEITPKIKEMITVSYKQEEIEKEFVNQGMIYMKQDGILKASRGLVTLEDILLSTD